jgi:polar amino acid transport system substrate-binding protein
MRSMLRPVALAFTTILVAAACSSAASPSAAPTTAPTAAPPVTAAPVTAAPSEAPSAAATPAPTQDACAPANLTLVSPGKLTIGTDNPAYPPYFAIRTGGNTPPWEDLGYTGDPTTGEGFESAVAYAVAQQLGFPKDQVTWVVVPFANAIAPGPKTSDFVINQVSYSAERAKAVDLSDGYYDLNQAVVALKSNPAAKATTIADLKGYKFGAQVGTTSYQAIQDVIAPSQEVQVYNDNAGAIQALQSKLVDAIVVDLPTADYITNVQIENGAATIVGQMAPTGGVQEHFSLALGKGSALTSCVNKALTALGTAGMLKTLASTWLPFQDSVPVLK